MPAVELELKIRRTENDAKGVGAVPLPFTLIFANLAFNLIKQTNLRRLGSLNMNKVEQNFLLTSSKTSYDDVIRLLAGEI